MGTVVVVVMIVDVVLENDRETTVGAVDRHMMIAVRHEVQRREPRSPGAHEGQDQQERDDSLETTHWVRKYRAPATASRRDLLRSLP